MSPGRSPQDQANLELWRLQALRDGVLSLPAEHVGPTPQEQATLDLLRWQAFRDEGKTPNERVQAMFADFFADPAPSPAEYEITLRQVDEAVAA